MIKNPYLIDILGLTDTKRKPVVALYNPYTAEFIENFNNDEISHFSKQKLAKFKKHYSIIEAGSRVTVNGVVFKPSTAEIYVELTEACNFNCPGCAVGVDRYQNGLTKSLEIEELKTILYKIFKSAKEKGINEINIKWSGGEPMMPKPFSLITNCQGYLQKLENELGLETRQRVLTNGSYLNIASLSKIDKGKFHFCVSLWGLEEDNTLARNPKTPNGNFENIKNGIRYLYENDYSFNIHHVITPSNSVTLPLFLTTLWDICDRTYIAKCWKGRKRPIPLSLSYLRPQTLRQSQYLAKQGYRSMLNGTLEAFKTIKYMIDRGVPIQALERLDYLNIYDVCPMTCGSGFNYIAVGPRGYASCHEGLFNMTDNLNTEMNIFDLVNKEYEKNTSFLYGFYKRFPGLDERTAIFLSLHGGSGCPRNMLIEEKGLTNIAGSVATELYAHLYNHMLNLEYYRISKELTN
jgi:sulfatase maturation enzyme AslB (radical SAM superfamily)